MNKDALYTARWFIRNGVPIPKDTASALAAIEAITAMLGELPVERVGPAGVPGFVSHRGDVGADGPTGITSPNLGPPIGVAVPMKRDIVPMFPLDGFFPIIGAALQRGEFAGYLKDVADRFDQFRPTRVVIHHTASPNLNTRLKGFERTHMANIRHGYIYERNFKSGPHLFTDEDEIWLFNPLWLRGTHAVAWNSTGIGIEMLGDFDHESPTDGRGRAVIETTAIATACLLNMLDLRASNDTIKFHREDPNTDKTCPGKKVDNAWFVRLVDEHLGRIEEWI